MPVNILKRKVYYENKTQGIVSTETFDFLILIILLYPLSKTQGIVSTETIVGKSFA